MQVTLINSTVLGGQGTIGSKSLGVANPAPGVGPISGDASIKIGSAEANEPLPAHIDSGGPAPIATPAPSAAETVNGGPHTFESQYSTQGPIPKG